MAEIQPFRGVLYNTQRVKPNEILTQPYDKITPEMRERYGKVGRNVDGRAGGFDGGFDVFEAVDLYCWLTYSTNVMTAIAKKLDEKLRQRMRLSAASRNSLR